MDDKIVNSLKESPAHPSILAKKLNLPRTTISYRLNRLEKYKIVSMQTKGRKSLWYISSSTPSSYGPITIYKEREIENAYAQLLDLPKGSVIMSIQCAGAAHGEITSLPESFIRKAHNTFKNRNFIMKGISNESVIKYMKSVDKKLIKSHIGRGVGLKLFSNQFFTGDGEIFVSEKFILIANPSQKIAVVCKDNGIINALKDTFTTLYDLLEDIKIFNINQYFKDLVI